MIDADPGLHALLLRQLRKLGLSLDSSQLKALGLPALLQRVSRAYADADQDRYLLEHSQDVASREMATLYGGLQASQARLTSLLSLSSDWVWEQDPQLRFSYVSEHTRLAGAELSRLLMGCSMVSILAPPDAEAGRAWRALLHQRLPFRDMVCLLPLPQGESIYVRLAGEPVFDGDRFTGYRGVGSDITQAARAEQQVRRLASFDSLTGLFNRNLFQARLDEALTKAHAEGSGLALMFIDLDRFKNVNDSLGHHAGDELLKVMARRLQELLREVDLVARLGGDEFVVLIDGTVDPAVLSKVANRMLVTLSEPLRLQGRTVQVSASVGVSLFPCDGVDAATLLRCADAAMYQAKAQGRNKFCFFTPELAQRASAHFALEGELREALPRDELRLHYQPKFDTASGELLGLEALVRWMHPQHGLLLPAAFIALAEESGLICALGRWVLHQACRQICAWRHDGLAPPMVSINLSVRQLTEGDIVGEVHDAMALHALEGGAIEVEITESLLMADPDHARRVLQRLHAQGVQVAIDDFGTGYSSLAYLKRFPAATLKLDRSFVHGLPEDRGDVAITLAVLAMARSMGLTVVAEGVETQAQLQFLRSAGCAQVQGYLLGRPMAPEQAALLMTHQLPLVGQPARIVTT